MSKVSSTPCQDFHLQMWLLLSEELPETEQKFWQRHLQSCLDCQAAWANAKAVQTQYQRLPLYEAPARIVHQVVRSAQTLPAAKWWSALGNWRFPAFARMPRLALAGVAFAVLFLSFHYLAFQKPAHLAWEATAFDEKVDALAITLQRYVSNDEEASGREYGDSMVEFSWDEQAAGLRQSIAALASELQNAKR